MGKKLAIRGHATRDKEVIELLQMMGGTNPFSKNDGMVIGNKTTNCYYISDDTATKYISWDYIGPEEIDKYEIFTLEEFLEEYPHKVGDKVVDGYGNSLTIKSMSWDENYKTVMYGFKETIFVARGDEMYLTNVVNNAGLKIEKNMNTNIEFDLTKYSYEIKEGKLVVSEKTPKYPDNYEERERTHEDAIFDSIIWHLRNSVNNGKQNLSGGECEDYFREVVKKNNENKMKNVLAELLEHIKTTPKEDLEREFEEIAEWSNVGPTVEEFRTFCKCVNKKPVYPKTYAECAKIMNCPIDGPSGWLFNFDANIKDTYYRKIDILMGKFIRLRICRDAYWKIYGEQMGLDGPWKANFTQGSGIKYNILFANGEVIWNRLECEGIICSRVLAFPTPEIRDIFYENFKDLIEECKELL